MLKRLGIVAHARRRVVVAAWLAAIIALAVAMSTVGSKFSTQFNLPDVESAQGFDLLAERFGGEESGRSGTLVVQAEQGFTNAQRDALNVFFAQLDARDDMRIVSPFSPEGARQVSPTGTIAFATVTFPAEVDAVEEFAAIYEEMKAIEPVVDGVQIEYGGEVFAEFEAPTSEVLGLAFAIVILIFAFGSVLAMGLPIGTAFGGIGVGVLVVTLASNLFTIPDVATTLGVMIGLGVGIDYALFIVTRYREARRRGESCEAATAESIDTAGRAVLFAGTTVVISLLGMLIMSVSFMNGLAIGASITVLFTMLASVTLLPALLGFVGDRVEVTRWRGIVAAGLVAVSLVGYGLKQSALLVAAPLAALVLIAGSFVPALRRPLAARRVKPMNETSAYRWSRVVQRRPWVSVIVGTGALLALALPVLDLRLGFADE
ncbi:MAG: MMPL family transporter, partial [Acidimicrobiia bacterium]|nr:MMPL family transporter [Acidimicrobiia bacterium]